MAEQLAVEVDVKNVTEEEYTAGAAAAGQAPLFCLDIVILEVQGPMGPSF